jgi:prefoldin alpha subunit
MEENKELQEKVLAHRILEVRLNALLKNRDQMVARLNEIENTIESINEIKKNDGFLFPLGSDTYVFGNVTNKEKLVVEMGAGVAFEKTFDSAIEILKKKKSELEKLISETQEEISKTSLALEQIDSEIQKLVRKSSK